MTDQTDALTPREALHREAMWGLLNAGADDASTTADKLIDAYTRELADKIRDNLCGDGGFPDGMNHAADLIDPDENPHAHCGGTHATDVNGRIIICQKDQP